MRPAALHDPDAVFDRHIPVLRSEALGALTLKPGGIYVDGTFGAGGYTSEILAAFPDVTAIPMPSVMGRSWSKPARVA
jgi:hypothetical protein